MAMMSSCAWCVSGPSQQPHASFAVPLSASASPSPSASGPARLAACALAADMGVELLARFAGFKGVACSGSRGLAAASSSDDSSSCSTLRFRALGLASAASWLPSGLLGSSLAQLRLQQRQPSAGQLPQAALPLAGRAALSIFCCRLTKAGSSKAAPTFLEDCGVTAGCCQAVLSLCLPAV